MPQFGPPVIVNEHQVDAYGLFVTALGWTAQVVAVLVFVRNAVTMLRLPFFKQTQ